MTKQERYNALMPNGIPRYIRIYGNQGKTFDEYTCVYTKKSLTKDRPYWYMVVGMSEHPFSPLGFGQHSEYKYLIDAQNGKRPPAIGRKNHLGKRLAWWQLPKDCQELVLRDYKELWDLK